MWSCILGPGGLVNASPGLRQGMGAGAVGIADPECARCHPVSQFLRHVKAPYVVPRSLAATKANRLPSGGNEDRWLHCLQDYQTPDLTGRQVYSGQALLARHTLVTRNHEQVPLRRQRLQPR